MSRCRFGLLLAVTALGCTSRTTSSTEGFVIESVVASTTTPAPGSVIDVTMVMRNDTSTDLRVLGSTVYANVDIEVIPDSTNQDIILAGQTLQHRFVVALPSSFDALVVDGSAVGVETESGRAFVVDAADAPLLLERPPPPTDFDFVVTVSDDELDGAPQPADIDAAGGFGDISLREAIALANISPGPSRIGFDPAAFSELAPAQITLLPSLGTMEILDADTDIDARQRGVILIQDPMDSFTALSVRANRCSIQGLEFRDFPFTSIFVRDVGSVSITDNEFITAASGSTSADAISLSNATAVTVARNRMTGSYYHVFMTSGSNVTVVDNDLSGARVAVGIVQSVDVNVQNNSFISMGNNAVSMAQSDNILVEGNDVETTSSDCIVVTDSSSQIEIRDNQLRACGNGDITDHAIEVSTASTQVTISQNRIFSSTGGVIVVQAGSNDDLAPPMITSPGVMTGGTAPPDTTVELFSDDALFMERFLGRAIADGAGNWSFALPADVPSGHNLTATATDAAGNTSASSTPVALP